MKELDDASMAQIREELATMDPALQARAFKRLVDAFIVSRLLHRNFINMQTTIFECFSDYGGPAFEMLKQTLPWLITNDKIKPLGIIRDFRHRVEKIKHPQMAFKFIYDICEPDYNLAVEIALKVEEEELLRIFSDKGFERRNLRYLIVFVFAGVLPPRSMRRLAGNHERMQSLFLDFYPELCELECQDEHAAETFLLHCSDEELIKHPLEQLNLFEQLKLMQERPNLGMNPRLKSHLIFVPFIASVINYRREISPFLDQNRYQEATKIMTFKMDLCATEGRQIVKPDFEEYPLDLDRLFNHIVFKNQVATFVKFVEHYKESLNMFKQRHVLPFLSALINHCEHDPDLQRRLCDLICYYVSENPALSSDFVYFFMFAIHGKIRGIPGQFCVDSLIDLAVNKYVRCQIVTFFCAIFKHIPTATNMIDALAKLVQKHADVTKMLFSKEFFEGKNIEINFREPAATDEVFFAKLELLKQCVLSTDDNEETLRLISEMIQRTSGARLREAVKCVHALLSKDVLELDIAADMFREHVQLPGNTESFGEYCRMIGYAQKPNDDFTEEENEEMTQKYIKEVFSYTTNEQVSSVAWEILGGFKLEDLKTSVPALFASCPGTTWAQRHQFEQEGFAKFLSKLIDQEVDSYPRPLYNRKSDVEVMPFLSHTNVFKDQLTGKNTETWYWTATLPLSATMIQLTPATFQATNALRLIKSCLVSVPPSNSREDTLRLMASWRLCVTESLRALSESKSNDLLWARDQICHEGKTALAEKKESVDNIMIMLTALASAIQHALQRMDDLKQADDVVKAQMPWLVSVFEFIATRLPKEQKALREPKANPIYEMLTHSNKSSLFIAIFCIRQLYRIPWIQEYYGDVAQLKLVADPVFTVFFEDPSLILDPEHVMDRKWTWIMELAYDVDSTTASNFEENHKQAIIDVTERFTTNPLETPEDIELYMKALTFTPARETVAIQSKAKKMLEKMWNTGDEGVRQKIFEGIAEIALVTGFSPLPNALEVSKLPESSVLRGVLQNFNNNNSGIPKESLRKLLPCFVYHKRTDNRYLPPVDWMDVLERIGWREIDNEDDKMHLLALACEQKLPEVLFYLVNGKGQELSLATCLFMSQFMLIISKLLPQNLLQLVVETMVKLARTTKDKESAQKLADAIASVTKNPVVRSVLMRELPQLNSVSGVSDIILNALQDPSEFRGLSPCFNLWLEARKGSKMNIQKIIDTFFGEAPDEINGEMRQSMMALISLEAHHLSMDERYQKVLDVVTASRIRRGAQEDMSSFLQLIMSLIVSPCDEVDIPLCWFDNELGYFNLLFAARKKYIVEFVKAVGNDMAKLKPLFKFLLPYIFGEEMPMYSEWDRTIAVELALRIFVACPNLARAESVELPAVFWRNLLQVP